MEKMRTEAAEDAMHETVYQGSTYWVYERDLRNAMLFEQAASGLMIPLPKFVYGNRGSEARVPIDDRSLIRDVVFKFFDEHPIQRNGTNRGAAVAI